MAEDLTKPYFGNPNVARQGAKARELARQRAVETLPDPRTYGFVSGLMGTPPDQLGMSVLSPNTAPAKEAAYYGYQLGNAAQIAPAMKGLFNAAKTAPAMVAEMRPTPLPDVWYHGTNPEAAQAIKASGKFDPAVGKRTYEYSELGPQTVYFAPEGSWWLDPVKAADGRAASYKEQVGMKLAKDANVKVIDSPKQFDKLAKSVGYQNGADLRNALWADNLQGKEYADEIKKLGSFDNYFDKRLTELEQAGVTPQQAAENYGLSLDEWIQHEKENYVTYMNWDQQYEQANKATKALLDKGIDGVYFSPKFSQKAFDQQYTGSVAGDQLGIFNPSKAQVVNPAYRDPFGDTTK